MSNPIYQQLPIRCEILAISNPPAAPIDRNTGQALALWKGRSASIQWAIFNGQDVAVSLANLQGLQLIIKINVNDPVAVVNKTLGPLAITPVITRAQWVAGTSEQANFQLSPEDTDIAIGDADSLECWMALIGYTAAGDEIVYAAGPLNVFNLGPRIPPVMNGIVNTHTQTAPSSGDVTISPIAIINTEILSVNGPVRTFNVILANVGMPVGGEILAVLQLADLTAGIVIIFLSGTLSGSEVFRYITDGIETNAAIRFRVMPDFSYKAVEVISPGAVSS